MLGVMVHASLAAAAALSLWFAVPARAAEPVDLALVLAVDSSSSVNFDEFRLQMRGLADAFRSRAVINAIKAAAPNGIAVTLVQWSSSDRQALAFGWADVRDAATAGENFPGNMFVPIDALTPILDDLLAHGRSRAPPARPGNPRAGAGRDRRRSSEGAFPPPRRVQVGRIGRASTFFDGEAAFTTVGTIVGYWLALGRLRVPNKIRDAPQPGR